MELIKQFLQRFSNLTLPDDTLKRFFIDLVKQDFNLTLTRDQITVKNKVLIVKNTSSVLKSELFLRKQKIVDRLKEGLGPLAPEDIR